MRKEFKDVIEHLAPTAKKMLVYCGAKLINILMRWGNYRMARYPEPRNEWIYLTQEDFCRELLEEHSIHCIRDTLNLLERIKLVDITRNWKWLNNRNGQTRTYQYRLNRQLLKQTITTVKQRQLQEQEEAESLIYSQIGKFAHANCKSSYPSFNPADPRFTVEEYTQIPYTETSSKTSSLKRASADFSHIDELEEELAKEEGVQYYTVITEGMDYSPVNQDYQNKTEQPRKKQINHEGQFSVASGGFVSLEERDNFSLEFLEFAKHKPGVQSPVSWTRAVMRSIDNGESCIYLDEFRRGDKIGTCEQRDWEIAPGQPYDYFVTYLSRQFKTPLNSNEQATKEAFKMLADVHQARMLWEGYKRHLENLAQQWEKQQAMGVMNPYIPPEILPHQPVSNEQAAAAINKLAQASQVKALAPNNSKPQVLVEAEASELETPQPEETICEEQTAQPVETTCSQNVSVVDTPAATQQPEPEPAQQSEAERRQEVLRLIPTQNQLLKYGMGFGLVKMWVEQNSDLVQFNEDGIVVAIDDQQDEQQGVTVTAASGTHTGNTQTDESSTPDKEPESTENNCIKVGDYVFVNSCPHTDKFAPFEVLEIDGEFAQIEMFPNPVRISDLRLDF
ncbi:MAG TPA: hypothetical protein V6D33_18350 [Cyanophyceae cyanobacterium]